MTPTVRVNIPTVFRRFTGGMHTITVHGSTVAEALEHLSARYESIGARVSSVQSNGRSFVRIYLRDEDIDFLEGMETPVGDGDEISIIVAVAGG